MSCGCAGRIVAQADTAYKAKPGRLSLTVLWAVGANRARLYLLTAMNVQETPTVGLSEVEMLYAEYLLLKYGTSAIELRPSAVYKNEIYCAIVCK